MLLCLKMIDLINILISIENTTGHKVYNNMNGRKESSRL